MGASILSVVLLAVILLSDSVVIGGGRRTEFGHAKDVDAAAVSSNQGRTFLNFDSSPSLTHLEFNGGSSSNLHRDDVHGGGGDPAAVFPPSRPHDTGSLMGDYDYATYDQSNYPQWHQVHLVSSEHDENAAQPFWSALGQQQPMPTQQPPGVHSTKFHPTHSFFGSMFMKGSSNAGALGTTPPAATENRPGSTVDTSSKNSTTTPVVPERATVPTSVKPDVHGDRDNKALQNGAAFATTATESLVQQTVGITAATTTGSPPTFGKLVEASATPGVRPAGSSFLRATSSPVDVTTRNASEPSTEPDVIRGAAPAVTPAVSTVATVASRGPADRPTTADFHGNEAFKHTTKRATPTAATGTSGTTSLTVPAPAATDILPRQAVAETVPPPEHSGTVAHLATPPAGANQVVETTTGRTFTNVKTATPPAHLQTSASETETAAMGPVRTTPSDRTSSKTAPSTLSETTKQPSEFATSQRGTLTTVQDLHRHEAQDLTTTQATTTSSAVSEVAGLSGRLETTTNAAPATSTPLDDPSQNHTAVASTRAGVEDGNDTSTQSQISVEFSTSHSTLPAVAAGLRRLKTTTSPNTLQPEPTQAVPTVVQGTEETPAKNASFQQTLPPKRPASPVTTVKPEVTADAYVRPITQHGPHEFVPQRHRDVEDYFYHRHQMGHIEDDDQLRQSQCGRCQRRLHYCVQKCFTHHSCEAETNPELTCPRINAPCMPPYKHEVDQCRHSADCESANHLCCLVGCSRRCVHGVPTYRQH
ncbi:mucin-5AC [Rhipicephalus sanguineus]|uniref:WAP domain-containing protein n=1 Tax=Rhipicephalus sanguineus TaxID=34632 RepID=A0A9D4QFH7_RHISA|nr:mucin-5AC [Rhipicephalus sanguineus]KAH7975803.1 hypothetical protein HPB52_005359 [Rhipicephalus sanguineus]